MWFIGCDILLVASFQSLVAN